MSHKPMGLHGLLQGQLYLYFCLYGAGQCGRNSVDLYSGSARLNSRPGLQPSSLRYFVVFFSSSRQILKYYFQYNATAFFRAVRSYVGQILTSS
jgi:hypothetical protein